MSILLIAVCIALLVVLISYFKVNAFLSFLIVSILAGLLLGIDVSQISSSVQKGVGDMLGSLVIVVVAGAMLGKLVADSGAAQRIAAGLIQIFGQKNLQWALMTTGLVIGIPLFYNVGFVLVFPLIASIVYRYNLPAVYIGLPMMAALSVTHGFLPPHPSPTALVAQFNAHMGTTLLYGFAIAIPTVLIAGLLYSKTLKGISTNLIKTFQAEGLPDDQLPGLANSLISALLPVIFLAVTTVVNPYVSNSSSIKPVLIFLSDPAIVMLISLGVATFSLGILRGTQMKHIMNSYGESVKDITMVLLIMGGAGGLKQVLIDSGISNEIATMLDGLNAHPLVLGWIIASIIRVCVGSATVAGLTAAGIMLPFIGRPDVDPNLMVLSIGAGSLMFSHVNDAGFWLFKEYFNLSIRDTVRSWSVMETIVAVCGLGGVMIINSILN
ncbi:MAG: gluconate transporter [Bacteroidetes bacterium CHB5]|nr:gluconate transporter [Bacteroidetes bacterium CHB5]